MSNNKPDEYTPFETAEDLLRDIPFVKGDTLLEPCYGEGAFYKQFPKGYHKDFCEIELGKDFFNFKPLFKYTKVITNPPYYFGKSGTKKGRVEFIEKCFKVCCGQVWLLLNLKMWNSLTPTRLRKWKEWGFNISFIRILAIKKWWGRYYWVCFSKNDDPIIKF